MPNLPEQAAANDKFDFPTNGAPECNWGEVTSDAILDPDLDFDQGPHASDPSGDGHGPGTVDEPRDGLANVVEDGNIFATCDLIDDLLMA